MNYVYPRLSEKDLGFVRLGGSGLGNLMFPYARALVFARENDCRMIWPTWPSVKLGPILRGEKDKRFYHDLFDNNCGAVDGLEKIRLLKTLRHVTEEEGRDTIEKLDNCIVEFEGLEGCFEAVLYDSKYIDGKLRRNLKIKNRDALAFDFSHSIGVHVRLGDFARVAEEEVKKGRHDSALPIQWYVKMIRRVRDCVGEDIRVWVFSDGTEKELKPLLSLPRVQRLSFGAGIADIMALSRVPLLIASGSSFSMWARYLGRMDCICYPNQRKQEILTEKDDSFEVELDGPIPEEIRGRIRRRFGRGL